MTDAAGTVLVADDDSDMRSLYQCWLAEFDDVRTAADGAEALRRFDETVDVVLLDREMPKRNGEAVARELDRREADPAVVMISSVEPDVDLLDIPVDDYLRKPVSGETVLERIERAAVTAASPPRHRRLVALDTRRRIVEAAVPRHRLAGDPNYQRTVDHLECAGPTLEDAQTSVPAVAGEGGGEPPLAAGSFDRAAREPRQ
ncbi:MULTISPECIES: response regulator transcription factor [Haloarcula]|uniref:response regulator transcription factor n=1 Tax=Haloarcula TaxID=2237 RepID=UPI0023E7D143|nr:response regulator [Halomicroarcula sp. SHR3]